MATLAEALVRPIADARGREPGSEPPQPSATIVWLVCGTCLLLLLALFAAGPAPVLRVFVPLAATLVGVTLYLRRPVAYVSFTLWVWFLSALLRRLIDWRFGYEDQNLVLLAPYLVSMIAGLSLVRRRDVSSRLQLIPFVLCIAGIFYGFCVGVIRWELHSSAASSLAEVVYGMLRWLAPLLFGLHLYLRWPQHKEHERAVQQTFLWAVLLLGVYGVVQFLVAPAWDAAWLEGLPQGFANSSFGRPEPYGIRVWSTLNAPGPFAAVMSTGLILLFVARVRFKLLVTTAGYLALLLSLVRTAWLGWILAMLILLTGFKGAALRRYILGLLLLPICFLPILASPQIQDAIQERLASLQSGDQDGSFQERRAMYNAIGTELLDKPSGLGLVNELTVDGFALDSGILQTLLMLGFAGTALFGAGILLGLQTTLREGLRPRFLIGGNALAYRAIFIVLLTELVSGNVFVNVTAAMLWLSLGMWMSAVTSARAEHPAIPAPRRVLAPRDSLLASRSRASS